MPVSKSFLHQWCETHAHEQFSLLKTLAAIPAPSHQEQMRAAFIKDWLQAQGAEHVTIDAAQNVVMPLGCNDQKELSVYMAHTDVVFPDTAPLPVRQEDGRLYAPGVGDDTANVVALMLCAKFFLMHPAWIPEPMLFVFNSCEEGLGNLKGVRQIMQDYAGQVREVVSFDCQSDTLVTRAVGSERWNVSVSTCGGHSFSDFGNPNAICHLSELISRLYRQPVPEKTGTKTTFNVGLISGGTSVNTIAQHAEMTYEYRSDDLECLSVMADQFQDLLSEANCKDAVFTVKSVGNRPCGASVPEDKQNELINRCMDAIQDIYHEEPKLCSASTDANIPLSLGIPAVTFGLYRGGGAHTREEYVELDSLIPGLKIALRFILQKIITE